MPQIKLDPAEAATSNRAGNIGKPNTVDVTTANTATEISKAADVAFRCYLIAALAAVTAMETNPTQLRPVRLALRERRLSWLELHRAANAARRAALLTEG
ncbi:MAG TPA: hypothetical protein VK558_05140 [Patescibacteria group bacterium]|nr:hypothetical protein [Patescibacteria group bacterium]